MIGNLIKGRYIHSGNAGCLPQKVLTAASLLLAFLIKINQFPVAGLSFSNIEDVKEICDRLRIIGTRASTNDNRILIYTILCKKRYAG